MDTVNETKDQQTICCYYGMIIYDFWKSNIKCHAQKRIQTKIENYVKKIYNVHDDLFLEFKMIYLSNNRHGSYDELWFIDTDSKEGLLPIHITDISGSSYHALSMCSIIDDEYSERLTIDQILNLSGYVVRESLEKLLNAQL